MLDSIEESEWAGEMFPVRCLLSRMALVARKDGLGMLHDDENAWSSLFV